MAKKTRGLRFAICTCCWRMASPSPPALMPRAATWAEIPTETNWWRTGSARTCSGNEYARVVLLAGFGYVRDPRSFGPGSQANPGSGGHVVSFAANCGSAEKWVFRQAWHRTPGRTRRQLQHPARDAGERQG